MRPVNEIVVPKVLVRLALEVLIFKLERKVQLNSYATVNKKYFFDN